MMIGLLYLPRATNQGAASIMLLIDGSDWCINEEKLDRLDNYNLYMYTPIYNTIIYI